MKKRFVSALLAVMMMGIAVPAAAAPSISQIIPEQPKVIGGAVSGKQELVVQNADTKAYKDKKVAEVVNKANDENTIITVMEIVKELGVDTSAPIVTTGKKKKK